MMREQCSANASLPLVVKLGGSLIDHVPDLVSAFRRTERPLVIVPGGGVFADTVRKTPVGDSAAHWMAIAAMDQYGWYIASHGLPPADHLVQPEKTVVFLPYCTMRNRDPLPKSWTVTSDSIAAWIADVLSSDLLILKSVDGIMKNNHVLDQVDTPVKTETVDPFFLPFVLEKKIKTFVINGTKKERVEKFLLTGQVLGTRIGTTF